MPDRLTIEVHRDGLSRKLQLGIHQTGKSGAGHGYRLAGPKFSGSGETLLTATLDERDAAEIRRYLNAAFPEKLAGLAEVAGLAVVSRKRAWQLTQHKDFPAPVVVLAATPVWRASDVQAFLDTPRAGGRARIHNADQHAARPGMAVTQSPETAPGGDPK